MFTPSILTILGVIMYLRLPLIVGEGGLYLAIGIIVAAHIISVTTGLSVSSIATDKRVEAGGAYYIVSRSMGLAIGGTLGIALFVGLSFSISLYIIGFSESLLGYWGLPAGLGPIRVCGTITLVVLTAITFISTSLAIRAQYLILALIVGSLVSIGLGGGAEAPASPHLLPAANGQAATTLFGIFFPAVTGFTAGVNMSGDLRDPRRAIPLGTVAAIAVGMVVYIGLAVFVAFRVPVDQLLSSSTVLIDLAWWGPVVVAGIWGATISSALGSILGAPRILQALSLDQITPRLFGIGQGESNEPRYALLLAFVIGEAGILIGELDAIARIVSVFFIATYGFLNLSASFEMVASPDFRPEFRIPRWVPVVGAAACAILMIWLDLLAMLGAVVALSGLFFLIKRRELQLETGDTLLGVWSSVVRVGLHRLTRESQHQRNWLPNILLFTEREARSRQPLLEFGHSLIRHRGVATEFLLQGGSRPREVVGRTPFVEGDSSHREELGAFLGEQAGFFHREVVAAADPYATMEAVCRFHGFSGLEPNTVMLDWHAHARRPDGFAAFLDAVADLDFNLLGIAFDSDRRFGTRRRIDLWASPTAGSLPLNLALVRFVTAAEEWRRADLRFFVVTEDAAMADSLHKHTTLALQAARIEGAVKVVEARSGGEEARTPEELAVHHSAQSDLTVVGLPLLPLSAERVVDLEALAQRLGSVLFVRPSSQFESGFVVRAPAAPSPSRTAESTPRPLTLGPPPPAAPRPLRLPSFPELAPVAKAFAEEYEAAVDQFCERGLAPTLEAYTGLLEQVRDAVAAQYREFERATGGRASRWRSRIFRRGPERVLKSVSELISTTAKGEVDRTSASVERALEDLLDQLDALEAELPRRVDVARPPSDFEVQDDDPGWRRRFKRWKRATAGWLGPRFRVAVRPKRLAAFYVDVEGPTLARDALLAAARHTSEIVEDLGGFVAVLKESLGVVHGALSEDATLGDLLAEERQRVIGHIEAMIAGHAEASERQLVAVRRAAREQQQRYADDLEKLHFARHLRRERRVTGLALQGVESLELFPERWARQQVVWWGRASLLATMAVVQSRLARLLHAVGEQVRDGLATGERARAAALLQRLRSGQEAPDPASLAELQPGPEQDALDISQIVDDLHEGLKTATADVPADAEVLREESLQASSRDPLAEVELVTVPVRRQLQLLIEGELVGPLHEGLEALPKAEQRVTSTVEEVVRLVRFAAREADDELPEDLTAALDTGIERLAGELERLDDLVRGLLQQLQDRLDHVVDLTSGLAVLGTAEAFASQGRRAGGPDLSGGLGRLSRRVLTAVRRALVTLIYRRSAGVLLARRIGTGPEPEDPIDSVLALVDACTPPAATLSALPAYYVQLFTGQSALHSAFWVDRERELGRIERGIAHYGRGFHGAIYVIGEPGSGKTALCEVAIERYLRGRTVHRIAPPPGGSADPEVFRDVVLAEILGPRREDPPPTLDEALAALPKGAVLLFHDAELWWERSPAGFAALQRLTDLIERHGDRLLFFVEMGRAAYRFLDRYASFGAGALARVECGPVDAQVLKEVAMLRHASSGLRLATERRPGAQPSDWALAQLFAAHFDRTDGNVGAALHSWLAHIAAVQGDTLVLRTPGLLDDEPIDALSPTWVALLLQIVLHKQLTVERLLRITGLGKVQLLRDLAALRRTGLVTDGQREVIELEPRARHLVLRSLHRRGMLP